MHSREEWMALKEECFSAAMRLKEAVNIFELRQRETVTEQEFCEVEYAEVEYTFNRLKNVMDTYSDWMGQEWFEYVEAMNKALAKEDK